MLNFTPHEYQRYCIGRILDTPFIGLYLDMGLGKTVITLTAINELIYNRFAVSRVLIIAPKKVAEATWSAEAAKWEHLKHLRFSLILGSEKQRIRAACSSSDIYVVNRENVVWLVDYLRNAWNFDMVLTINCPSASNTFISVLYFRNGILITPITISIAHFYLNCKHFYLCRLL